MSNGVLNIGLVSTEAGLRSVVDEAVQQARRAAEVEPWIAASPAALEAEDLERIRDADPQVLMLDLTQDPAGAIRVAGTLAARFPGTALMGIGPDLPSGLLLDAMRAGLVEYLPQPASPEALYEALGRVLQKRGWARDEETPRRRKGNVMAFFSAKGGAGATTVATNTAIEIHRITGKRTLLVDLDLEMGEIATLLGVQPRFHFIDLVRNFHRLDADLLASYIDSHDSGVHVLSAPFEPEIGEEVTSEQIGGILRFLRSHYDYLVVDTSKSLAPPVLTTFREADQIFLITNADVPSIRNLKRSLPALDKVTGGDAKRLRLVVNRFNPKGLVRLTDLEETLGMEIYATLGNDYRTVIESISTGRPLVLNGSSRYADEIRDLAADIAEGAAGERPEKERKSLVGRLLAPFRGGRDEVSPALEAAGSEVPAHG
ncbi:MAG: AAA family ATPase [Gemmatimonadota bacterium]|jgi:pilus assembly protein CpaE